MEQAAECCREILHHVNQAVRDMEDLLVSLALPSQATSARGLGLLFRPTLRSHCLSGVTWILGSSLSGSLEVRPCSGLNPWGSLWGSPSSWLVPETLFPAPAA